MDLNKTSTRYKLQQKIKAIEKYLNKEASQYEIAREFKVDQKTISRWVQNKEKLIALMQSNNGKQEMWTRKNLPRADKGSTYPKNKKQKRLHKMPSRYGFEDSDDEESVDLQLDLSYDSLSYGDPFKKSASMKSVELLHEHGFFVYPNKFSEDDIQSVLLDVIQKSSAANKWRAIFNPNLKRHQCKEFKHLNYNCMKQCVEFVETINEELQPRQWVVLRNQDGAQRQYAHTDYHPQVTKSLENKQMPLLAFIPLEDNTQMYIWSPSNAILDGTFRNVCVKPSVLTVNRGDLVVFTGRLIHAGGEWNGSPKYRLHCYFHHPFVPFPDNATWKIVHNTDPLFEHVSKVVDEDNAY